MFLRDQAVGEALVKMIVSPLSILLPVTISIAFAQTEEILGSEREFDGVPNWRGFRSFGVLG